MFRIVTLSVLLLVHPVHVTLLSLDFSEEEKSFNAFLKVYYDDFLLDFRMLTGLDSIPGIDRDPASASASALTVISKYLEHRLSVYGGRKILKSEISDVSLDLGENELYISMRFKMRGRPSVVTVSNSILADIYPDQSNLLIFRYGDLEEGVKLTPEKREQTFKIK